MNKLQDLLLHDEDATPAKTDGDAPSHCTKKECRDWIVHKIDSESKCHFRGVIFCCVPGALLCTKEKEFCCLQGRSEGLFRKMTLVVPCFVVYVTYEQVSLSHGYMGRFPGELKNDTLKMATWTR